MMQQVFISYRQESPEHTRAVRRLGELLRQAKLPVALDQFHLDDTPGGPEVGWPAWCEACANNSACVLIIGSQGWFAAYDKRTPPGLGLGAASEADIIRQKFYDTQGRNTHIRLAFLHDFPVEHIPTRLKAWHQYHPFTADEQLNQMIRWMADCLGLPDIVPPTVRWPKPTPFTPDLADRIHEWPAIVELIAGQRQERILLLQGESGMGKSALIRQTAAYAKQLWIRLVRVDFKGGGLKLEDVLGQFDLDLEGLLPNFSREGAGKPHLLRKDLRGLRQPVLVIFDSFEDATCHKPVTDWLHQQFLPEVETALGLVVMIAGQKVPEFAHAGWRDQVRHLPLAPILDSEHWVEWVGRSYPHLQARNAHLPTIVMAAMGNPAILSNLCANIVKGL
jgi:hypothetical protein